MFLKIEKTVSLNDLTSQIEHDIKTAEMMIKDNTEDKDYYIGARDVLKRYLEELSK